MTKDNISPEKLSLPERQSLPDLTDFDFSDSPLFESISSASGFVAEQLSTDETIYHNWGRQDMKAGDWVLLKPSPSDNGSLKRLGVRREAFELTYVHVEGSRYRKESFIRAQKIPYPFSFVGIDCELPETAPAGAYLVLNLDKNQQPIAIDDRRDLFYYNEGDLFARYRPINDA